MLIFLFKTMTKSEKIISEFFKPYFKKYPELNSIWFIIHNMDGDIHLEDEDCGINGFSMDELSNEKMYDASYKIQDAIRLLRDSRQKLDNTITELEKLVGKLQKDAGDSNPLNKLKDDVWNGEIRRVLTKKVDKHLKKEISWKHVNYCHCLVGKDGIAEIELM